MSYVAVAAAAWWSASSVIFVIFGAMSLLTAFVFLSWRADIVLRLAGALLFGLFGMLLVFAPFVRALRVTHSVANGVHVRATVIDLVAAGPGRQTLDALKHGFAAGTLRAPYRNATFDERFEYDGDGAGSLRIGDTINVLIDPDTSRVLFVLGPLDRLPDR